MKLAFVVITSFIIKFAVCQSKFVVIQGIKAHYSVEIPTSFNSKETIGKNIDLKFVDKAGASIVTNIRKLPPNVNDENLVEMSYGTDEQTKSQLEANGMEEVNILNRGFLTVNGVNSYFIYYTSNVDGTILYFHSVNQFKGGNMINLTITCENSKKASYMPLIFRTVNSLKH